MQKITLFMWPFQGHFRVGVTVRAEALFQELDQALDPEVLLIGRYEESRKDRHPLCIEPEDGDFRLQDLAGLEGQVQAALTDDPEASVFDSHPGVAEQRTERVRRKAFATGVCRSLEEARTDRKFFASLPETVDGYLVTTVLHFDRTKFEKHAGLVHDTHSAIYPVATSLVDAVKTVFLSECVRALRSPSPGRGDITRSPVSDALRSAGRLLMDNPGYRLGPVDIAPALYDRFCEIAALTYEGDETTGRVLVTSSSLERVDVVAEFAKPVSMDVPRMGRKVLEMASSELDVIATPGGFVGLGRIQAGAERSGEDLFEVDFLGRNAWLLRHGQQSLMRVRDGVPALPSSPLSKKQFEASAKRLFTDCELRLDLLWTAVESARSQKHGALIVVSSGAESEARRLANQSTMIRPAPVTRDLMVSVTAIDGAVLIDPGGSVFAIGVILDGMASEDGDRERGSRFNSALRYVRTSRSHSGHCVAAIVVSEDGMIDMLPPLMPQIARAEIESRVNELRASVAEGKFNRDGYQRSRAWLEQHAFYLDTEQCDEVNGLVDRGDEIVRSGIKSDFFLIREPLRQHPDFDPTLITDGHRTDPE